MSSVDGDTNMNDTLDRDQDLGNFERLIIKIEEKKSALRGSIATPTKPGAISRFKTTPTTKDRPIDSIEKDGSYDPVTPAKSSARSGRGRGGKRTRSGSLKETASIKVAADKVAKNRQNPKKRDTKKDLKNLDEELLGEILAEDEDHVDDWENEYDGVRSDENTWDQVNKVIGSTGKPTHPNGRAEGRKLVAWHRTRMMEKLILHIVFECRRANINLPWDKIAHRLCPASSGAAAQQYINKMRDVLITEGHLVPPPLGKKAVFDPSIRGYIRDMDAKDPKTSRAVGWDEEIVDLKESLVIPGISRGSGTYRRDKARWQINKATIDEETPTKMVRARTHTDKQLSKSKSEPKEKPLKIKKERSESLDPAEMPSDEDYDPGNRVKIKGCRKRKVKVKSARRYETDEDIDRATESENESFGYSGNETYLEETPSKKNGSESYAMTLVAALPVKLKLSPNLLSQFPAGVASNRGKNKLTGDDIEVEEEDDDDDRDRDSEGAYEAKAAINISARDGDDVFGPEGLSIDNRHGLELRTSLASNSYLGGMSSSYGFYYPRGSMNAPAYIPGYNSGFNSNPLSEVRAPSFGNTHGDELYPNRQFLSMRSFNAEPDLHTGMNFGDPNDMMQDMNGDHNGAHSFSHSTGVGSGNSSFARSSADTDYYEDAFDNAMASIAPGQHFEPANEDWDQELIVGTSFGQDQGL